MRGGRLGPARSYGWCLHRNCALFPDVLEVKIADTAPAAQQAADAACKPPKLANGVDIMVPQFVKTGDLIRLDLENMPYMDRARAKPV